MEIDLWACLRPTWAPPSLARVCGRWHWRKTKYPQQPDAWGNPIYLNIYFVFGLKDSSCLVVYFQPIFTDWNPPTSDQYPTKIRNKKRQAVAIRTKIGVQDAQRPCCFSLRRPFSALGRNSALRNTECACLADVGIKYNGDGRFLILYSIS